MLVIINIIINHWLELGRGGRHQICVFYLKSNSFSIVNSSGYRFLCYVTITICCLCLFLGSAAVPNKKTSIFSVGEITRLMKFPGVARTFIVKIAAGLPSGETVELN